MRPQFRTLLVTVLVSLAVPAAAVAGSDPFSGTWTSIDLDGSNQRIAITLGAGGVWTWDYVDDRATSCGGAPASGTGSATVSGTTLAGNLTAVCDPGSPLGTFPTRFTFDSGTGKLTDGAGVVWTRVATASLTVATASARVSWRESKPAGSVSVSGTVSGPAALTVVLLRPSSGKVVAQTTVSVTSAGPFAASVRLPRSVLPGVLVVRVTGVSSGADLPQAEHSVSVGAPPEGVVARAYASTKRGGPPVLSVSGEVKELWARFQFAARPKGKSVTVYWVTPSGQVVGSAVKPYSPRIDSFVGSAASLQNGVWRAVLKVGGKVVKRVAVRVK